MYEWIKNGEKTIDIRKGKALRGDIAVFQFGQKYLRTKIVGKESGKLSELVKTNNYSLIIPSAKSVEDALKYIRKIYAEEDTLFTAYYLAAL